MTQIEINKAKIETGDYGCLVYQTSKGNIVRAFGKIKLIDSDGLVLFKDDFKARLIPTEQIKSFNKHEMLPPPTEYAGKDIEFDGGVWLYKSSGKEANISR